MSFITDKEENTIERFNTKFRLDLSFDVVLLVQDLYKEDLSKYEKLDMALELFVINNARLVTLTYPQKDELLNDISTEFVDLKVKRKTKSNKKVFDFNEDAEYIYSSFMCDYKLDLISQQGKLSWKKFIALFQGLSANTKIKEIMSIRGRELPKPTKYNQAEIQSLIELKNFYALGDTEENFQDGLDKLFSTLEKLATN